MCRFLERWADLWYRQMGSVFLQSYLKTTGSAVFIPQNSEDLQIMLEAYLLDKAVYEIGYELNQPPRLGRDSDSRHQTHFEIGVAHLCSTGRRKEMRPSLKRWPSSLIILNTCSNLACVYKHINQFMNKYLDKIDNDIAAKHLLKHPFYLAWTRGELSKEALTDYARQSYHHVAAFPTYLSAVHANCDDQATRKQLLNNLIDEEAGSPNHPELWKKFADGLGVGDAELAQTEKQPETKNLIRHVPFSLWQRINGGRSCEHFTHTRAKFPSICESKIDGLKNHYGFTKPEHYEYFTVHIEADREHSAAEREMLSRYLDDHNFESVKVSVNRVLDALWEMLSGVCRRHAIAC